MDRPDSGRGFFSYALTWDDQSYIEPYLKVAVQIGHPPTAVILNDPSHTEWTSLDYKLAKAYELRQSYGDIPPWIDRSERVAFDVKTFVSKSAAAVERKQDSDSKKKNLKAFGRRYYATPRTIDEGPLPTMQEYLEEQRRLNGE
jgi:hypothetical protein